MKSLSAGLFERALRRPIEPIHLLRSTVERSSSKGSRGGEGVCVRNLLCGESRATPHAQLLSRAAAFLVCDGGSISVSRQFRGSGLQWV